MPIQGIIRFLSSHSHQPDLPRQQHGHHPRLDQLLFQRSNFGVNDAQDFAYFARDAK